MLQVRLEPERTVAAPGTAAIWTEGLWAHQHGGSRGHGPTGRRQREAGAGVRGTAGELRPGGRSLAPSFQTPSQAGPLDQTQVPRVSGTRTDSCLLLPCLSLLGGSHLLAPGYNGPRGTPTPRGGSLTQMAVPPAWVPSRARSSPHCRTPARSPAQSPAASPCPAGHLRLGHAHRLPGLRLHPRVSPRRAGILPSWATGRRIRAGAVSRWYIVVVITAVTPTALQTPPKTPPRESQPRPSPGPAETPAVEFERGHVADPAGPSCRCQDSPRSVQS